MTAWYAGRNGIPPSISDDTVVFPDDGHIVARNIYRLINILRINIVRKTVHQVGFIYNSNLSYIKKFSATDRNWQFITVYIKAPIGPFFWAKPFHSVSSNPV
jgi:hypothetical protein